MAKTNNTILDSIAKSVRILSADATRAANSGHPGLPLGLADLGALLFSEVLQYNPKNPNWINRDRLVLSAGHGSMWLYSLLHLSGYGISLNDLKKFRQFKSKTAGHPEYGHAPGIETTTGPLGAGFSNAVGMAMAEAMLSKKFHGLIDYYTYVVSGDGCMQEGVSSEAASFAGHNQLGKLIVFYDSNGITIEGATEKSFSEDVGARFRSYGWQVLKSNAHNYESLRKAIGEAKKEKQKPTIIICKSTIGKGAPTMQGSPETHGAPLPQDEIDAMKKKMGVPNEAFYIDPSVTNFFTKKKGEMVTLEKSWGLKLSAWKNSNKDLAKDFNLFISGKSGTIKWPKYKVGDSLATRKANGACIAAMSDASEFFVGGSADLAPSNNTKLPNRKSFSAKNKTGQMIHFGVREHAMGGIVNGLVLSGFKAFGATFLVFSDYMRPTLRLASIMRIPSIFVFTHDSIFVGEDGPTHQPVEHVPSLRMIPNLRVFRPGDAEESVLAWKTAYSKTKDPSALMFTRQNLSVYEKPQNWKSDASKGAYVVKDCSGKPDVVLVATGSEVQVAIDSAEELKNKKVRVVSMICKELFDEQKKEWKDSIVSRKDTVIIVEAAIAMGWDSLAPIGQVGIDSFGACGPAGKLKAFYGLNGQAAAQKIKAILKNGA